MTSSAVYHKKVLLSYAADVVALLFFGLTAGVIEFLPVAEYPIVRDPSLELSVVEHVWVPSAILPLFNMGLPLLIIVAFMAAKRFQKRRLLLAVIGMFMAVSLGFLVTNILKNSIGKPRPDFFTRTNQMDQYEQRRSFPSGHASSSFAGLGFAAFFMAGQIGTFDGTAHLWRFLVFLAPLILAGLVAVSRIVDHRHHCIDVLAGSVIGICAASCAYFFYFPSLGSEKAAEPRSLRFDQLREEAESVDIVAANTDEADNIAKENIV